MACWQANVSRYSLVAVLVIAQVIIMWPQVPLADSSPPLSRRLINWNSKDVRCVWDKCNVVSTCVTGRRFQPSKICAFKRSTPAIKYEEGTCSPELTTRGNFPGVPFDSQNVEEGNLTYSIHIDITKWTSVFRYMSFKNCDLYPPKSVQNCVDPLREFVGDGKQWSCDCKQGYWENGGNCSRCMCPNFFSCNALGSCVCPKQFTGPNCDRCSVGYSGASCDTYCGCVNGGTCRTGSSQCQCLPGYTGVRCENSCTPNKWGIDCSSSCNCLNGGTCDPARGCTCVVGFSGAQCQNKVTCPVLAVSNTTTELILREGNSYLNRTVTRCRLGFVWTAGQHHRSCTLNGTWSGSAPVCESVAVYIQSCAGQSVNTTRGIFTWPLTSASASRSISCPVVVADEPIGEAIRVCDTSGKWEEADLTLCPFSEARTRDLQRLLSSTTNLLKKPSTHLLLQASNNAAQLTNDTADTLNEDDVKFAADVLDAVAEGAATTFSVSAPQNMTAVNNIVAQVVSAASNIASASLFSTERTSTAQPTNPKVETSERISASLERLAGAVPLYDVNEMAIGVSSTVALLSICPDVNSSYELELVDHNSSVLTNGRQLQLADLSSSEFTLRAKNPSLYNTNRSSVMFSLPAEALDIASQAIVNRSIYSCSRPKASFVVYGRDSFFRSVASGEEVISPIVSAQAESRQSISLSSSDVEMTFRVPSTKVTVGNLSCSFWDKNTSVWRDDGCMLVSFTNSTDSAPDSEGNSTYVTATCRCNHLTNFALLVRLPSDPAALDPFPATGTTTTGNTTSNDSATEPARDGDIPSPVHARSLSIISTVGCALSAVCLLATSVTILSFADLRGRVRQRLTLCLSLSLLVAMVLFPLSSIASRNPYSCQAVAILLHFSLLSAFAWMSSQATLLYKQLVVVFDSADNVFFKTCCATCFGIPIVTVAVTAAASSFKAYRGRSGLCFLATNSSFYGAFLAPMLTLVIYNIVVTILVIRAVRRARSGATKGKEVQSREDTLFLIRIVVSLSVLVGMTWLLGALVPFIDSIVLQYFFAVLNSFQGVGIFYFYTLSAAEVQSMWKKRASTMGSSRASMRGSSRGLTPSRSTRRGRSIKIMSLAFNSTSSSVDYIVSSVEPKAGGNAGETLNTESRVIQIQDHSSALEQDCGHADASRDSTYSGLSCGTTDTSSAEPEVNTSPHSRASIKKGSAVPHRVCYRNDQEFEFQEVNAVQKVPSSASLATKRAMNFLRSAPSYQSGDDSIAMLDGMSVDGSQGDPLSVLPV